jgi:hypothetical protein
MDWKDEMNEAIDALQKLVSDEGQLKPKTKGWKKEICSEMKFRQIDVPDSLNLLFPDSLRPPVARAETIGSGDSSDPRTHNSPLSGLQDDAHVDSGVTSFPSLGSPLLDSTRNEGSQKVAADASTSLQSNPPGASETSPRPETLGDSSTIPFPDSSADGSLMSLDFLGALREDEELFFPETLYVRKSMRLVSSLFSQDDIESPKPTKTRTVLLGSPGVGKSILFFLAALVRSRRGMTIYYRKTESTGENLSVFVMFPGQGNKVNVLFTRGAEDEDVPSLYSVDKFLKKLLSISRKHYWTYVDGPRHDAHEDNLLRKKYDYLCTSGGHPPLKSEQEHGGRMWVLDAWTKEEGIEALTKFGHPDDRAREAYWVCGGSIRDMLKAIDNTTHRKQKINLSLKYFIDNEVLAEESSMVTERRQGANDRLRRMFRATFCASTAEMAIIQLVDSEYALKKMREKIPLGKFFDAYKLGVTIDGRAIQGLLFECIIHRWFATTLPSGIKKICWSTGTGDEGVAQLVERDVYWVPSICNFPAIDSAVVIGDTIHALQITIRDDHPFTVHTFKTKFVDKVKATFKNLRSVVVYLVVPKGTEVEDEAKKITDNLRKPLRQSERLKQKGQDANEVAPKGTEVDTESKDSDMERGEEGAEVDTESDELAEALNEVTLQDKHRKRNDPALPDLTYRCVPFHVDVTTIDSIGESLGRLSFLSRANAPPGQQRIDATVRMDDAGKT